MEYLASWRAVIWSGANSCFDLVWQCCQVALSAMAGGFNCPCDFHLPYLYIPDFKHQLQKTLFVGKKNDWLKNRPFFITENFLGILNWVCTEPMRRSHDFLNLTWAIVRSTSGKCYFLLQYQCLSVSVLCVLVVRCVKS